MDPTTIRLPPTTLDELDSEYSDYGYGSRADYIRAIIEHRDPPFDEPATTPATTTDYDYATTDDYERLRDRVDELEARVADLEAQPDIEARDRAVSVPQPRGLDGSEPVVEFVKEHGPVSKSEIEQAFEDEWQERGIKASSWYERHAKPALRKSEAEHTRNIGWDVGE